MKNLIRSIFVIASVLLLVSASTARPMRAAPSTDAEFISFLEEAWVNAILEKNVKVLDRVMADDFRGVSPNGVPYTKQEAIEDVRSGFYAVKSMELANLKVRILGVLGDTAIVTYYQNEKSKFGDEDCTGRYVFTDVWVNQGDDWRVIASHGAPVELP
jgi:ketosteroid isomerase-like protein